VKKALAADTPAGDRGQSPRSFADCYRAARHGVRFDAD